MVVKATIAGTKCNAKTIVIINMKRNKEIFMEMQQEQEPMFDSAGYSIADRNNQLDPPPDQINVETGKCMWEIKGYRIWANSYPEALEHLILIESL